MPKEELTKEELENNLKNPVWMNYNLLLKLEDIKNLIIEMIQRENTIILLLNKENNNTPEEKQEEREGTF
jgi:hypothetical protein